MNLPKNGKLNIDTLIISKGLLIHEKTRVKKSHATVPLRVNSPFVPMLADAGIEPGTVEGLIFFPSGHFILGFHSFDF